MFNDNSDILQNAVGDSFWNTCFAKYKFFRVIAHSFTPIFGWSEPFPLVLLNLVLLIVLPAIFKVGSFLKVSRLYNMTRLGLLSLFHQICYSYTIGKILTLIFRQPRPCDQVLDINTSLDFAFPSPIILSASLLMFTVAQFTGISLFRSIIIWFAVLFFLTLLALADQMVSIFQAVSTFFFGYVLHSWHVNLPFKYIHYENACLLILSIFVTFKYANMSYTIPQIIFAVWFSYVTLIIDELLILRHHMSRRGFPAIERPKDLKWTIETEHVESIRLLNSEEEETFTQNVKSDLSTSFISFCVFYVGVLLRRVVSPEDFFASPE